ncbi:TetR family transcriptional regulator [Ancylobacter aquaticus]|uniref:TetR family transcriptional regulator n=1 Tax=Ancylobacter aquaticus TaxID=100 RepID=A0A4R1I8V8_ANCAQ|nr:TetR/AcrR family transcriptional regulator [Ancylobacter aquaticus]TCK30641.1 TetR family transcriptional regulator [Ancylobacter aquaticus]
MQNIESTPDTPESAPSRSRGRPRAFDRDAALAQAMRLFWIKGFEATSIADLTHAMGIGSPSLYAAFGSKQALYVEALRHYERNYEGLVWAGFRTAETAEGAIAALLYDSASALTGNVADIPLGCMVALASVGSEEHRALGELVCAARAVTFARLEARLQRAVADGEISAGTDCAALARFVQTVQTGMSLLARDGTSGEELEAVAALAMAGVKARLAPTGPEGG